MNLKHLLKFILYNKLKIQKIKDGNLILYYRIEYFHDNELYGMLILTNNKFVKKGGGSILVEPYLISDIYMID